MIEIRPTILEVPQEEIETTLDQLLPLTKNLHLDVEDGLFVPRKNNFDPEFTKWVKSRYGFSLDVHLMVQNPMVVVADYLKAGADLVSFHFESSLGVEEVLEEIKRQGKKACLALKLETNVAESKPYWDQLEEILLMSVNPGFGGQAFNSQVLERIKELRSLGWTGKIKVDGGVKVGVAHSCVQAGADILVAGTALFESGKIEDNYQLLVDDIKEEI